MGVVTALPVSATGRQFVLWGAAACAAGCGGGAPPAGAAAERPAAAPSVSASTPLPDLESLPPVAAARLPAELRRGRTVYDAYCWTCHGLYGHGDGPLGRGFGGELPELGPIVAGLPEDEVMRRMRRPPARAESQTALWHGLASTDARAAVAYIATFTPPGSRGNPEAGRLIYATYCVHCHGSRGAGDGRLARALSPAPADLRVLDLPRRQREVFAALKARTAPPHGGFMPAWGRLFDDQQLWDVIAFLPALAAGR